MTMKYHVASSAMVSKIVVTWKPRAFDFFAHKVTNKNARTSDGGVCIVVPVGLADRLWFRRTVEEGEARIGNFYAPIRL
jgi:hypothetical protein